MTLSLPVILFGVVLGIQILSFLGLLLAFLLPPGESPYAIRSVSIIVCARNEESNLRALIPLLLRQNHKDFEVIVVDDRSVDGTRDLMNIECQKDKRLKLIRVDYLPEAIDGKKHAITKGIERAGKEIVLLTDADCRPAGRDWVREMTLNFHDDCRIVLGYSPYLKTSGLLNTFIRFEALLTGIQYLGMARLGLPYMGVGRNLAYRKSFFMEGNGFSEIMEVTGGDDDLWVNRHANRYNTRICIGPASLVYSIPKRTWGSFLNQKLRHLSVGTRYRFIHKLVTGTFHASLILSWILGIFCIVLFQLPHFIFAFISLRLFLLIATVYVASGRLGDKFSPWPVMFLDFLYVIYYISTGLRALATRKVQWMT
jgi:cellulose synthase/poly-beta-1,6-N-acetylglucosamine synthase-like glycosyltransferase